MLILNADLWRHGGADLRIEAGKIAGIGRLTPREGEETIDARGGALLPGLHDHHIHLPALAAAKASVACGPPDVTDESGLAAALAAPGEGWLRGTGYHESVAGLLDRPQLDRIAPGRPVRIQHRGGRMWFLNSRGLEILLESAPAPRSLDVRSGRLFDADSWLRSALGGKPPSFAEISRDLALTGVTGITDLTPSNDAGSAAHVAREQRAGDLLQSCVLGGTLALADSAFGGRLALGPAKLHLHEAALPGLDTAIGFIVAAHRQSRPVAVHCVTETELVFALAALGAAGSVAGDRIEHASVAPDPLVEQMAWLGTRVVSQPQFVAERGDLYLRQVDKRDRPYLYRLGALRRAGIVLAGGSDAPFGDADPWAAMRAAVTRRTAEGFELGIDEALTPEEALALYLCDPLDLARERKIAPGCPADLCLLDRSWPEARDRLRAEDVRITWIGGSIINDRVDQAPVQRGSGVDAPA